jgi:hypothetical protein
VILFLFCGEAFGEAKWVFVWLQKSRILIEFDYTAYGIYELYYPKFY